MSGKLESRSPHVFTSNNFIHNNDTFETALGFLGGFLVWFGLVLGGFFFFSLAQLFPFFKALAVAQIDNFFLPSNHLI